VIGYRERALQTNKEMLPHPAIKPDKEHPQQTNPKKITYL
jgi:hypothetical protein